MSRPSIQHLTENMFSGKYEVDFQYNIKLTTFTGTGMK